MSVQLDHTIVHSRNQRESAEFLADVLGLDPPGHSAHFDTVQLQNGVTLDFMDSDSDFDGQHYAFLVDEHEFEAIVRRVRQRSIPFWADPFHRVPNRIYVDEGGRGFYFTDPGGHNLEVITKPQPT